MMPVRSMVPGGVAQPDKLRVREKQAQQMNEKLAQRTEDAQTEDMKFKEKKQSKRDSQALAGVMIFVLPSWLLLQKWTRSTGQGTTRHD
jgi:hypothetical protein